MRNKEDLRSLSIQGESQKNNDVSNALRELKVSENNRYKSSSKSEEDASFIIAENSFTVSPE